MMIRAHHKSAIRTERRFAGVATLEDKVLSISLICREHGLSRNTVRRFYCATDAAELFALPASAAPGFWTSSQSFSTHVSTTDIPPLPFSTKNFR